MTAKPNILDMMNAIDLVKAGAAEYVKNNPEGPNWFPCGFAWLAYKCRKNAKEAGTLISHGFRWDDYEKVYSLSPYQWTNTQSMDYKEAILQAGIEKAKRSYPDISFYVRTRED